MPFKRNAFFQVLLFGLVFQISTAQTASFTQDSIAFDTKFMSMQEAYSEDYENARKYYNNTLIVLDSLAKKYPDRTFFLKRKADILNKISLDDIRTGDFALALQRLNEAINIKKEYGKPDEAAASYYLKGIVWVRQGEYDKVKINYDSAYVMTERNIAKGKKSYISFKGTLLNLYGTHYANIDSIDKAEYYFKKSIAFADSIGDKNAGALNRLQYAEVIKDLGRHKEALALLEISRNIYKKIGPPGREMDALSDMATSYNALGEFKKAYLLKKQLIEHLKDTGQKDRLMREYPFYIEVLESNKKYKEAFLVQKEHALLRDSLRNAKKYKELADLDAKFKYENQKSIDSLKIISERKLVEAAKEKKATTQFWIVVLSLLFILVAIAYYYVKNKQKIKEQAYQNILLNNKVATKTEEINELLTETIQHIKSKERIAENLQKLSNENEGVTLKSIIADLKASKADNAKLMLIKQNIEQVNFEFIKKLKNTHPELTKTDVEICSLIRIGLSRKEVANLRNTSLEAVKTSRFRLKKKLNLSADDALDDYINTL